MEAPERSAAKYELLDKKKPLEPLTSSTDSSIEVPNKRSDTKYELLDKKRRKSKKTEKPTTIVIEKDIVKKDTKAAKREALTKKGSTLLKKADGEEEEKHVEARLEVSLVSSLEKVLIPISLPRWRRCPAQVERRTRSTLGWRSSSTHMAPTP